MTIDTRLVNARLVDSSGVHHSTLSIDDGRIIPDQETDDVWRTVDASGHLVFPGIIQPAKPSGDVAVEWAKRGTTTAVVTNANTEPAWQDCASFDWFDIVGVPTQDQLASAKKHGARAFVPRGVSASDVSAINDPLVLRLRPDSDHLTDWLDVENATLIVPADMPGAVDMARHERVVMEVSGPMLVTDSAEHLWDMVEDESRTLVTSGEDPQFPLLHFLYHEGHIKRGISLPRIAGLASLHAAAVFGLDQKAGYDVGKDGDLVVFDPDTVDPYLDSPWPGRVIFSLQRGNILLYNGQLHTTPGDGLEMGRR